MYREAGQATLSRVFCARQEEETKQKKRGCAEVMEIRSGSVSSGWVFGGGEDREVVADDVVDAVRPGARPGGCPRPTFVQNMLLLLRNLNVWQPTLHFK